MTYGNKSFRVERSSVEPRSTELILTTKTKALFCRKKQLTTKTYKMSSYVKEDKETDKKKEKKEKKKEKKEKLKIITQLKLGKIPGCKHETVKNVIAQNIDPDNLQLLDQLATIIEITNSYNPGCGVWEWCNINGNSRVVCCYDRGMATLKVSKN